MVRFFVTLVSMVGVYLATLTRVVPSSFEGYLHHPFYTVPVLFFGVTATTVAVIVTGYIAYRATE